MPTGIHTDSRRTVAEPRGLRSSANSRARRTKVRVKTIARTPMRYAGLVQNVLDP